MLAEKLANDIANAALNKLQTTKTAVSLGSLGRAARNLGLAAAGTAGLAGAGYAYTPEMLDTFDDVYHHNEGLAAGLARKGRRAAIGGMHSLSKAPHTAGYIARKAGLEAMRALNPRDTMIDAANYYGNSALNRGMYEVGKAAVGLPYRVNLLANTISNL